MSELDLSSMILDQNINENPIIEEASDEHLSEEVGASQRGIESLNNMALSPINILHQSLIEDLLEPHRR